MNHQCGTIFQNGNFLISNDEIGKLKTEKRCFDHTHLMIIVIIVILEVLQLKFLLQNLSHYN